LFFSKKNQFFQQINLFHLFVLQSAIKSKYAPKTKVG